MLSTTSHFPAAQRQGAWAARPRCAIALKAPLASRGTTAARSILKDAADGFMDLSKLVSGGGGPHNPYDELASEIGKQVYVDLAGWHLYTKDMNATPAIKMHQALAQQLGPKSAQGLRESDIEAMLKTIPVKAGAGKLKVSLYDIMPSMCVGDLTKVVEEYGRRK